MTPKELKALATVCRQVGISTFKGEGVEFTLQALPPKPSRRRREVTPPTVTVQGPRGPMSVLAPSQAKAEEIPSDSPTENDLLFWSAGEEHTEEGVA